MDRFVPTTPRPNHRYHPPTPIFRVGVTWISPVVSFSNQASVWVGSLLNCSAPPVPFHRSPSPSLCYFDPWFYEPSWPDTGPFYPSIGPFHRLLSDHVENANIQYPVSVWMGSFPSPSDPPLLSAPLHRRNAYRTFHAGRRLGWARPSLLLAPSTTIPSRTTPSATSATTDHTGTPWTPSPPHNFCRVYFGPRDRCRFDSQLREWRRGHWLSSWIGVPAAFRSLHRPPLAPPF